LTGRITKLIDNQQSGVITRDDGVEFVFRDGALIGTTFRGLQLGEAVEFNPREGSSLIAATVRLQSAKRH
jgi:hypothetical protein